MDMEIKLSYHSRKKFFGGNFESFQALFCDCNFAIRGNKYLLLDASCLSDQDLLQLLGGQLLLLRQLPLDGSCQLALNLPCQPFLSGAEDSLASLGSDLSVDEWPQTDLDGSDVGVFDSQGH